MQQVAIDLLGHGYTLQYQNDSPARGANVNRLVGSVQDQNGGMHGGPPFTSSLG
jgi:hypothetical protein